MKSEINQGISRKRKIKDFFAVSTTYLFSSFSLACLIAMVSFIVFKGYKTFNWDFITGNYEAERETLVTSDIENSNPWNTFDHTAEEGEFFSSYWGIGFSQSTDKEGNPNTIVSYVDPNANTNGWEDENTGKKVLIQEGATIFSVTLWTDSDPNKASVIVPDIQDAKSVCDAFDEGRYLLTRTLSHGGQGIRGSLVTTLYRILFTMAISLPLGIAGAIYLSVYAKDNVITHSLRSLIDRISGIPSIIFGLVGGIIFLPRTNGHNSILAGSFTMARRILPVIIKSTEEAIHAIPKGRQYSSLALGASQTQTTFKIVLPNALPGILTAALLGIGRVIGESAALIYTAGTAIQDVIIPTKGSASLAVHIWYLRSGEHQNFEASCGVARLILIRILILNISLKAVTYFWNKKKFR